jgi:hypothetical protein
MRYILLTPAGALPDIPTMRPFKAVIITEDNLSSARREAVSDWLVGSGCAYVMAWGDDCGAWEATIATSVRQSLNDNEVPDDRIVITTSHADEPLNTVFWFSKHTAMHPCFTIGNVVLLQLASVGRERELCAQYAAA